jgi:hypothetical protein
MPFKKFGGMAITVGTDAMAVGTTTVGITIIGTMLAAKPECENGSGQFGPLQPATGNRQHGAGSTGAAIAARIS